MSTVNISERANNQTITITLASLANNGQRSSAAVDNSTNLDLDELVQVIIATGSSGFVAGGYVNIYAYASADGGTSYPEGAGTDTGVTLTSPPNVKLIGRINTPANLTTYKSEPMSVAVAFGGTMPTKWGIIVENKGGGAFASTGNSAFYAGMQATVGGPGRLGQRGTIQRHARAHRSHAAAARGAHVGQPRHRDGRGERWWRDLHERHRCRRR